MRGPRGLANGGRPSSKHFRERRPLRAGASVIDIMGGTFAVVGILAALQERQRTGMGQVVRSSLYESVTFLMGQHMAGQAITGRLTPPMPAREGAWGIYEPFQTADDDQVFIFDGYFDDPAANLADQDKLLGAAGPPLGVCHRSTSGGGVVLVAEKVGAAPRAPGPPDFDGDGIVGINDLLALLNNWGPCL